jgi:hypothetical protein
MIMFSFYFHVDRGGGGPIPPDAHRCRAVDRPAREPGRYPPGVAQVAQRRNNGMARISATIITNITA